jgi:DNA-binding XRE family transcriptional regulator
MDEHIEEWRDIPGFPGYQASSLGRLKSLARMGHSSRGKGYSFLKRERILTAKSDDGNYLSHSVLSTAQPGKQTFLAHRLIALAFIPNPEGKPFVNHKNGIKTDNRPSNLEWCTKPENGVHAVETGLHTALRGESNGNSVLTERDVREIRSKYTTGRYTHKMLAERYGVGRTTVAYILSGKLWGHVALTGASPGFASVHAEMKSQRLSEAMQGREGKKGEAHPRAKLNRGSVLSIREKYNPNIHTITMLADEFGVATATIKAVLSRRLWSHV